MPAAVAQVVTQAPLNLTAQTFLDCLARADHRKQPYDHWLLDQALPADVAQGIAALPFAPPNGLDFSGKRDTNNSTRVYFNGENVKKFSVCRDIVEAFEHPTLRTEIERVTGCDLKDALLRVEYCQDTDGFWLEPHTDISVKKFTMLVYLSDDPALYDMGTDVYEGPPDFKHVGAAPYEMNKGLIFIPGKNTWHGLAKRTIKGVRKSIIINYVSPEWRDKWELAY